MKKSSAKLLLAAVFMARGTSFLFSKTLMNAMPALSILAVRFLLSFLVLACVFSKKLRENGREALRGGCILGVLYTAVMLFEMKGLKTLDSGVCSVTENTSIVLVPLIAAVMTKTAPKKITMLCALLSVIGVACLSVTDAPGGSKGMACIVMATVAFAFCILYTEKAAGEADPVSVGIIQLGTMGVLSLVFSLFSGSLVLPGSGSEWGMMLALVLVCSCFGFTFQPLGQKYVPAETAAVFTVLNPLTAGVMGVLIAKERLTPVRAAGCALILFALVLYNLKTAEKENKDI